MSNLITLDKAELYQKNEITFLKEVANFKKIRDLKNTDDLNKAITIFILELETHFAPEKKTDNVIINDIRQMILSVFNGLSLQELYYASKLQRYGVLQGENKSYGRLSTEFVSQMLTNYRFWKMEKAKNHNLSYSKKPKYESEYKSQEEIDAILFTGCVTCFDDFAQTGTIAVGYGWVYDHLDEKNIINYSADEKRKIMAKAKKELMVDKKKELGRNAFKGFLVSLENGNKEGSVVAYAKKLLLKQFFGKLFIENKHIKDFL